MTTCTSTCASHYFRSEPHIPCAHSPLNDRRPVASGRSRARPTRPPPKLHGARANRIKAPIRTGLSSLRLEPRRARERELTWWEDKRRGSAAFSLRPWDRPLHFFWGETLFVPSLVKIKMLAEPCNF